MDINADKFIKDLRSRQKRLTAEAKSSLGKSTHEAIMKSIMAATIGEIIQSVMTISLHDGDHR